MPLPKIYSGDSLTVEVTLYDNLGSVVDLTGKTVTSSILIGATSYAGAVTVTSAVGGVANCTWSGGVLPVGVGQLDIRVTSGSTIQTVYSDTITIKQSAI